ncbi:pyridoxamine 5'-phosphate oxidase family protein [Propionibacteriaceae bacterium Y1700]|uniref:pyridoxamine 5'-phosphate oxidase family protein n=1 Tax=Microlunatus sp. Y1700 TaxID=3418487 RepID=UPI003B7E56E6
MARMDGLVVAQTLFDSSANYGSAVVNGVARMLDGAEAARALTLMSEQVLPGRSTEVPDHQRKELAATVVLELLIGEDNWTAKVRTGGPGEVTDPDVWTGVVPLQQVWGTPEPADGVRAAIPASVRALT